MRIDITNQADLSSEQYVITQTRKFNAAFTEPDVQPIGVYARIDVGEVIAGVTGKTYWNYLEVQFLWVSEAHRQRGLATQLLLAAESEARNRGCEFSYLDTFSFQAPGFYRRLGYSEFGRLHGFGRKHNRHFLFKAISPTGQHVDSNEGVYLARWQTVGPAAQERIRQLSVSEQQVEYAGTIERSLDACSLDRTGDVQGVAIFNGQEAVGFFLLKRGVAAPTWATYKAVVVSSLRVDQRWQGQGIGTAALKCMSAFVVEWWPEAQSIMLSVDEDNEAARRAYGKAGWLDTGTRDRGRIGWVRYMTLNLRR
jgi:GNAT superfamily N-acetyltransferase